MRCPTVPTIPGIGRFSGGAAAVYADEVLADTPVAYWRLGEPSGTNANDEIGTNDGTLLAGATFGGAGSPASAGGTAVTLNGTSTGMVTFGNPGLAASFSLEAWVFCTGGGSVGAATHGMIFGEGSGRGLYFAIGETLLVSMGGGAFSTPAASMPLNAWLHVVYTFNGTTELVYINGVEGASHVASGTPNWNVAFQLGAYDNPASNYAFLGRIDEAAVYATALSPARVLAHYEAA